MATKTVSTFAQLKSAVEDTDTLEVLLDANITFTSGIKIPTQKKSLVIDGQNFTITDMNSSSATDALYVSTGFGSANITVKNVVWSGRNYYGVVCVYDDANNTDVVINLENVSYTGPQMIYNRYGSTVVSDCNISIEKNGASASSQEFCETNRLTLAGKTVLKSATTANAVMWFAFANASVTIEENANITISAPGTYLIYSDTAAKPKLMFKKSSTTTIDVKSGLFYASGTGAHIASSCTIEENATLSVTSATSGGVPLFKCAGDFSLQTGGSLFLILPQSGSSALMYFSSDAKVDFNSPKNVLLYNAGGKVFSFNAGCTANITAQQVNYWTKSLTPYASAGGFNDVPSLAIFKQDKSQVNINQVLSKTAVTSTTSNLISGDDGYPLSSTNFNLANATTLSFGQLDVNVNTVNDLATSVTGNSSMGANIRLIESSQTQDATTNENGEYTFEISNKLTVGEKVEVWANKNFLTTKTYTLVTGSVSIISLPDIPFNMIGTPRYSAQLNRIDPNWTIVLSDTRTNGGKWSLYTLLESDLQSNGNVIPSAITFTDTNQTTLTETQTLVATGQTTQPQKISLNWEKTKGILINIAQDVVYNGGKYEAKLKWIVEYE